MSEPPPPQALLAPALSALSKLTAVRVQIDQTRARLATLRTPPPHQRHPTHPRVRAIAIPDFQWPLPGIELWSPTVCPAAPLPIVEELARRAEEGGERL